MVLVFSRARPLPLDGSQAFDIRGGEPMGFAVMDHNGVNPSSPKRHATHPPAVTCSRVISANSTSTKQMKWFGFLSLCFGVSADGWSRKKRKKRKEHGRTANFFGPVQTPYHLYGMQGRYSGMSAGLTFEKCQPHLEACCGGDLIRKSWCIWAEAVRKQRLDGTWSSVHGEHV
ncbi:hypothetical protein NW759_005669 [Fusarium solani]|nr:hypothetical protein NW759_005669 [Fusarium solani]